MFIEINSISFEQIQPLGTMFKKAPTLLFFVFFSLTLSVSAQESEVTYPPEFSEPMPMYEVALGDFTYPISSKNKQAQEYFNQGFQMMYAFTKEDGARSFREAQKLDSTCAICHWGEAWAWGSYLNGRMRTYEAPRAYAAIQKASELTRHGFGSRKEKAMIEAMSVRYIKDFDPDNQREQDSLYMVAMKEVYNQFPNDLDIGTLYAESLFLLEPRRGVRDLDKPGTKRLHAVLEGILKKDIKHPGACHLYIHATESTDDPGKAEACAEYIGNSIPGASHINHMPSHTWNEIGRWGDAVRANIQAWHSDQKEVIGEGFAIYPSHNLHMLLFAGSMDGQSGIATQAGKDYTKLTGNNMYELLTLVRFGRFDEIPRITERSDRDVAGGMWDFAQGYAHLKKGEIDFAKLYLARVLQGADSSTGRFRFHSAKNLLGSVGGILEGEIHWAEGDLASAIASFERADSIYTSLDYDEPEPLPFAAKHWLGAALLEAGRYEEAEKIYREELEHHPKNGWSLFGIQQALKGQGKTDPKIDKAFAKSWERSDTWIRGSKF